MIKIDKQAESFLLRYLTEPSLSTWKRCIDRDVVVFIRPLKLSKTRLGYYQFIYNCHLIAMETTLVPLRFFLTLLHETAHLAVFLDGKKKVAPHGIEWQEHFLRITNLIREANVVPPEVADAYVKHSTTGKASSESDILLEAILEKYNLDPNDKVYLKDLKVGTKFYYRDIQLTIVKNEGKVAHLRKEDGSLSGLSRAYSLTRKDIISIPEKITVEEISTGTRFELCGDVFIKGKKLRTFYECIRESDNARCRVRGIAVCKPLEDL